jgi:hypothetical protein
MLFDHLPDDAVIEVAAYTIARGAECLEAAGGYVRGEEVDGPEQLMYAVVNEMRLRDLPHEEGPPWFAALPVSGELHLEESLVLAGDGRPVSYHQRGVAMGRRYERLRTLLPEQFKGVLAHSALVLSDYLAQVYGDASPELSSQVRDLQPFVSELAAEVRKRGLERFYQKQYLD